MAGGSAYDAGGTAVNVVNMPFEQFDVSSGAIAGPGSRGGGRPGLQEVDDRVVAWLVDHDLAVGHAVRGRPRGRPTTVANLSEVGRLDLRQVVERLLVGRVVVAAQQEQLVGLGARGCGTSGPCPGSGRSAGSRNQPSSAYISTVLAAGEPPRPRPARTASADGDAASDGATDAGADGAATDAGAVGATDGAVVELVLEHAAITTAASAAIENRRRRRGDPLMQPPGEAPSPRAHRNAGTVDLGV